MAPGRQVLAGEVEFAVLGTNEEAIPLVPVVDVRGLGTVLGVTDRHAALG